MESEKKDKLNIKISKNPEFEIPKFCNLVSITANKEKQDVIFDFLYYDSRSRENKNGEIAGSHVAKLAMTMSHAIDFKNILSTLIDEKKNA